MLGLAHQIRRDATCSLGARCCKAPRHANKTPESAARCLPSERSKTALLPLAGRLNVRHCCEASSGACGACMPMMGAGDFGMPSSGYAVTTTSALPLSLLRHCPNHYFEIAQTTAPVLPKCWHILHMQVYRCLFMIPWSIIQQRTDLLYIIQQRNDLLYVYTHATSALWRLPLSPKLAIIL